MPPRAPAPPAPRRGREIRIRMYRVGFGDCFLVSLPPHAPDGPPAHLLFDCGVHSRGDIGTLGRVVDDIARETGGRLAVLVATHAHQDHIAGYDRFADRFAELEIGEVWLPWTWNPRDPAAVRLQRRQAALAARLAAHFAAAPSAGVAAAAAAVENLRGNEHAIARLRAGFGTGARVRYLEAGDTLSAAEGLPVDGLSVTLLGPPRSPEYLAKMDPPGGNRYLGPDGTEAGAARAPFGARWRIDAADARLEGIRLDRNEVKELAGFTAASPERLAFALDEARNNESVVALLRFGGRSLLFPGDAQYGSWRWWMEHEELGAFLDDVSFLKVSHHGSVNATPRDALERMAATDLAAMVSTQSTPWPSIPRVPLMARLAERTSNRVVRSDWIDVHDAPRPAADAAPPRPPSMPRGFQAGELWIDLTLPLDRR